MKQYQIKYITPDGEEKFKCDEGTNLFDFMIQNKLSFEFNSDCSGKMTCGKCKVEIKPLCANEATVEEKKLLGNSLKDGYRIACNIKVSRNLSIFSNSTKSIPEKKAKIHSSFSEKTLRENVTNSIPFIYKKKFFFEKITDYSDMGEFTAVINSESILTVEKGNTVSKNYGIAIDVGTTTVEVYLVDAFNKNVIDNVSALNPQSIFGRDVITRINTIIEKNNLDELKNLIFKEIDGLILLLASRNNISTDNIYAVTIVGNTTMMHIMQGYNPTSLAFAPFTPVSTDQMLIDNLVLGLSINKYAVISFFPSVAAYVGADIISDIMFLGIDKRRGNVLLVDLGTNGEIVLGNSERIISCSVAAGPAFEGANIEFGMGGIEGAIERISLSPFKIITIGNIEPVGICGSGILDAVAQLYINGVVDETGRMASKKDLADFDINPELIERLSEYKGERAFLLTDSKKGESSRDIFVTQTDIRNIQVAKAAIHAGIKVIAKKAGITLNQISAVALAGGFGTYINKDSAIKIGLIPSQLKGKLRNVGNSAGGGAVMGLLDNVKNKQLNQLKEMIQYIELSADKEFSDEYVDSMIFPNEN